MRFRRPFSALLLVVLLSAARGEAADLPRPDGAGGPAAREDASGTPGLGEVEAPPPVTIADPLEPLNRAVFVFNDRFYYWLLRPAAKGYSFVVPEGARVSAGNFFSNVATPIRFAGNLLQGKFKGAGTEILRFLVNSTIGMGGLFDPARDSFHLRKSDEDLGQTLGRYGLGHGLYLVLPILGPSSLRDAAGSTGDYFLDPVSYIKPWEASAGVKSGKTVNETSLTLGQYEDLTQSAVDPYVAVRDAYIQYRKKEVEE